MDYWIYYSKLGYVPLYGNKIKTAQIQYVSQNLSQMPSS
jgi:hypothetical protein